MRDTRWLKPWRGLNRHEAEVYEGELARELPPDHLLAGRRLEVLGRRDDRDDLLVEVDGTTYAVVHLTWGERSGGRSAPTMVPDWEAFLALMRSHHREATGG